MTESIFDCIIIGGGIIGIHTAYTLLNDHPNWHTALLERGLLAGGASHFSAGLYLPYFRNLCAQPFAKLSHDAYRLLNFENDLPIRAIPFIGIVSSNLYPEFTKRFISKTTTIDIKKSDSSIASNVTLSSDHVCFEADDCHYADVSTVSRYLSVKILNREKFYVWEGVNVKRIVHDKGLYEVHLYDQRILLAKRIVLAPGPWVNDDVFKPYLNSLGIRIKKIVSFHIDLVPKNEDPVIFFFDHDAFLLPLHSQNRWIFSYTCNEWDVLPHSQDLNISFMDRKVGIDILKQYFPKLALLCQSGRVFCDAYGPDSSPIVTQIENHPQIIFAGAGSGSGYRLSPGIAKKASELLTRPNPVSIAT